MIITLADLLCHQHQQEVGVDISMNFFLHEVIVKPISKKSTSHDSKSSKVCPVEFGNKKNTFRVSSLQMAGSFVEPGALTREGQQKEMAIKELQDMHWKMYLL